MSSKTSWFSLTLGVLISAVAYSNAPTGSKLQDIAERKDNVVFYRITSAGGDFIARRYCRVDAEPTRDCPLNPDKPALILTKVTSFRGYLEPLSEHSPRPRPEAATDPEPRTGTERCIREINSFLAFIEASNLNMTAVPMDPSARSRFIRLKKFIPQTLSLWSFMDTPHSRSLGILTNTQLDALGIFNFSTGKRQTEDYLSLSKVQRGFLALAASLKLHMQNERAGSETTIPKGGPKILSDRYLTENSLVLVEKEIADVEDFLNTPNHTDEEIARAKADLASLSEVKKVIDFHETILRKLEKDKIILLGYSREFLAVSSAFERAAQEGRYIYDSGNRIWWVHLGLRNYFDAAGVSRDAVDIVGRPFLKDKLVQSSCAQKFGSGYRLPTRGEIAGVLAQERMRDVADWTSGFSDDGQVGTLYYESRGEYGDQRHLYREIHCVIRS